MIPPIGRNCFQSNEAVPVLVPALDCGDDPTEIRGPFEGA
jgi:hypothetical protein